MVLGIRTRGTEDRLEVVQVLRLVAALAVVGAHLPAIHRGHWGVDLFFVISGFVIALSSHGNSRNFLAKRIIRVAPIYWILTLGVFSIAIVAPMLLNSTSSDPVHLIKSLLFIPFDKNGTGHRPILFVGWTLNFEMYFYLVFAAALALSRKYCTAIATCAIFSIYIVALKFGTEYPLIAYGDARVLEFPIGMLVWLVYARPEAWQRNAMIIGTVVLIGLAVAAGVAGEAAAQRSVLLPAALSGFAVLAGALWFGRVRFPALLVLLGDASYSLYLSHAYVIQALDKLGLFDGGPAQLVAMTLVAVALCLALSAFLWLAIEKPLNGFLRARLLGRGPERLSMPVC